MRRSIEDGLTPVPPLEDDPLPAIAWSVGVSDDYDDAEPRIVVTVEEVGSAGYGLAAHLEPSEARRIRGALRAALRELGEDPGT